MQQLNTRKKGTLSAKHFANFNNCAVRLVHSGHEFFEFLEELIEKATTEIHLQFYIFDDDIAGNRIARSLRKAAGRGVKIYLLIDGFEARSLSDEFIAAFDGPNIHMAKFEPLFRSKNFYVGRRLHHKLCVFDGTSALVGGINIAHRYLGNEQELPWMDAALYLKGAESKTIRDICLSYWKDATGEAIEAIEMNQTQSAEQGVMSPDHCSVRIRRNDWVKAQNQIWKGYFEFFNLATESIVIMCSYFLPGWTFLRLIKKAVARGVTVKVILAGISDVMLAKHAERYLYRWMLRNGVEIYEYKRSVLHAKIAIKDHKWMTIGSYNVNNISALASIECNVEVRNKPFVSKVEKELISISVTQCERITDHNFKATQNLMKQFWQWCCYQLIKIILFLATFYFRREY